MIVVADASPLNYLVLIEQVDLLPALYGSVLIPGAAQRGGALDDLRPFRPISKILDGLDNVCAYPRLPNLKAPSSVRPAR